ncbi:MAG: hypothetical protein HRU70_01415 [Phycisphaeraceae bacterium]|nr:MAG: hypothetical protein HRU70_01415 [Phycisphaeraceae bacterium]
MSTAHDQDRGRAKSKALGLLVTGVWLLSAAGVAMAVVVGATVVGGCAASGAERARSERSVETGRRAVAASREGRHAEAAAGFAAKWRDACEPDGGPRYSGGTYVLAQYSELRASFRSAEGRPIAMTLLEELRARAEGPEAHPVSSAGFARLAWILDEPGVVASAVEARDRAGLGMTPIRPVIGVLLASGRSDLAERVRPSAAGRAIEGVGEGVATAGLIAVTAPISVPMALIATSGPVDVEPCRAVWVDPVRAEDL